MNSKHTLWEKALLIRRFEELLLASAEAGDLVGTTHCCIGQEANAVAVCEHLRQDDFVVSNHRCHGHYIAHTDDVEGLMLEVHGKQGGVVQGRGGSQHLFTENFLSNGILGGGSAIAAGIALANKQSGESNIVVCFSGDGALGQGLVYEVMNMASLWKLPVLFVVENNHIAQSTLAKNNMSGSILKRFEAFNIETASIKSFDVEVLHQFMAPIVEQVRAAQKPYAVVLDTYRFCHHSVRDDSRDQSEVEKVRALDPLSSNLESIFGDQLALVESNIARRLASAKAETEQAEMPLPESLMLDVTCRAGQ